MEQEIRVDIHVRSTSPQHEHLRMPLRTTFASEHWIILSSLFCARLFSQERRKSYLYTRRAPLWSRFWDVLLLLGTLLVLSTARPSCSAWLRPFIRQSPVKAKFPTTTSFALYSKKKSLSKTWSVSPEDDTSPEHSEGRPAGQNKQQPKNANQHNRSSTEAGQIDALNPSLVLVPNYTFGDEDLFKIQEVLQAVAPLTASEPSSEVVSTISANNSNDKPRKSNFLNHPSSMVGSNKFFSISKKQDINANGTSSFSAGNFTNATIDRTSSEIHQHQQQPPPQQQHHSYDPAAALAFLDSQANFTKQQLDPPPKILLDYSRNATKQLDTAQQRTLLEAFDAQINAAAAAASANNNNSSYTRSSSTAAKPHLPLPQSKQKQTTTTLTMDELEAYLRLNGYVRQKDLEQQSNYIPPSSLLQVMNNNGSRRKVTSKGRPIFPFGGSSNEEMVEEETRSSLTGPSANAKIKKVDRVAFPQPSVLSYAKLKWGCTVAASTLGFLFGITILPNLWLLGATLGGLYGYETTKHLSHNPPTNAYTNLIVSLGRAMTMAYLKVYDFGAGLWFMYKTGQLSYEYWKRYAALDDQFQIQSKMDAWNARFQKGKENFDRWERENEVGRKLLAGVRTVWLVEQQSMKKTNNRNKKSKLRFVQWGQYIKMRVERIYNKRGQFVEDIQAFVSGIWKDIFSSEQRSTSLRPRIAAALAAVTFVNLVGALFSVSPLLLTISALVLGGVIWPDWSSEWSARIGAFLEDTKARGRGEELGQRLRDQMRGSNSSNLPLTINRANGLSASSSSSDLIDWLPWAFKDPKGKERYHFYRRLDGTKRWYRTGVNPWEGFANLPSLFRQRKQEEKKPWWSLKS